MIRFREYPLLNTPNMVAMVMRAAAEGPATIEECVAALEGLLRQAGEHPPFRPEEVATRLESVARMLTEARLLLSVGDGSFVLSERGEVVLADHPQGFDAADLMAFPEFSRYVRGLNGRLGGRGRPLDPREGGYDRGFSAYWSGQAPSDNPFSPDTADHQAWENGWSEALDEDHLPKA